jgi:hypothetical protein
VLRQPGWSIPALDRSARRPLGYNIYYLSDSGGGALLPGSLRVTVNPQITSILDADTQQAFQSYQPGQVISISGTDLAESAQTVELIDGLAPTQLGGISVRIGDRFTPLLAVSPSEIPVQIPPEVAGDLVDLVVVVATGVQCETLELPLSGNGRPGGQF